MKTMQSQKIYQILILGHNTLTYSKAYIFIGGWNVNLGTLFYTFLRCKKFHMIGPSWITLTGDVLEPILIIFLSLGGKFMSRKGPKVGKGMLDFVEVVFIGVKSH